MKISGFSENTSPATGDYVLGDTTSGLTTNRFKLLNLIPLFMTQGITRTADANGWTVYSYGNFKKYTKVFISYATAGSVPGNTTTSSLLEISSTPLPSGIPNTAALSAITYSHGTSENSPVFMVSMESASGIYSSALTTLPTFYARNITSGNTNIQNLTITVELTT